LFVVAAGVTAAAAPAAFALGSRPRMLRLAADGDTSGVASGDESSNATNTTDATGSTQPAPGVRRDRTEDGSGTDEEAATIAL
jgi:hypothetical protein